MEQVRWNSSNSSNSKRVVIFRHGERVDGTFGFPHSWVDVCFDQNRQYKKSNLNMPDDLPERSIEDWKTDTPLTKIGEFQAHLVGAELKKNNVNFTRVYVSPSYRCLRTAQCISKALGCDLPMKVEYGLYEWFNVYKRFNVEYPKFMSIDEMKELFNIDVTYKPIMTPNQIIELSDESLEAFYNRSSSIMRDILNDSEGDILVVAHGISIDSCTRQLLGGKPRTFEEMKDLLELVPYLASTAMEKLSDSSYRFIEPPCSVITSKSCHPFDWKTLEDSSNKL